MQSLLQSAEISVLACGEIHAGSRGISNQLLVRVVPNPCAVKSVSVQAGKCRITAKFFKTSVERAKLRRAGGIIVALLLLMFKRALLLSLELVPTVEGCAMLRSDVSNHLFGSFRVVQRRW